jgi:putative drug exporter of the RND superfamily
MARAFARLVVWARVPIVLSWVVAAGVLAVQLPALQEAQTGALGGFVPADSEALEAERLSAQRFAFPLASQTLIVQRDARGLPRERLGLFARRLAQANGRGELPVAPRPLGAYGVTNAIPGLSFARERNTTTLSAPLYPPAFNQSERIDAGRAYAASFRPPPGEFVGVTGVVPAQAEQANLIVDDLPRMEIATVLLVTLAVAIYLRSVVAPVVTLLTVGVGYLVAIRLVAVAGQALDVSVPPEVEPIILALLFGVVTDYALFYMSRFRQRLTDGGEPREAVQGVAAELIPIVAACGLAVAAGSAVLGFAQLGFLRAFGPGMAMAVLIGLAVTLSLLPALLALAGRRLFWPSSPDRGAQPRAQSDPDRMERLIATSVRAPRRTIVACLALIALLGAGLGWLAVGNPSIRSLPGDSEPRRAAAQLTRGFAPGVLAPTTLIVTGAGITAQRDALRRLQTVLADEPGVAGVIGPATSPDERAFGIVLARDGGAARYVIVPASDPLGARAVQLVDTLRARTPRWLDTAGLDDARALYGGNTAILSEVIGVTDEDAIRVLPLVLLAVGVVLVVLLRALVAPLYLVLLATLSPLAAVGLAVVVFQGLLGADELTFYVPIVAAVVLIALGSDYNIFLVGRIWEEARRRPLDEAIVAAGSGASHAISAAGLVLAGSFAALAFVDVAAFQELAFVLAAGLLIDAFLVRSVLTPAVIALVGERSGWPGGQLSRSAPARVSAPAGARAAGASPAR